MDKSDEDEDEEAHRSELTRQLAKQLTLAGGERPTELARAMAAQVGMQWRRCKSFGRRMREAWAAEQARARAAAKGDAWEAMEEGAF